VPTNCGKTGLFVRVVSKLKGLGSQSRFAESYRGKPDDPEQLLVRQFAHPRRSSTQESVKQSFDLVTLNHRIEIPVTDVTPISIDTCLQLISNS
jgi:hypothetical protein